MISQIFSSYNTPEMGKQYIKKSEQLYVHEIEAQHMEIMKNYSEVFNKDLQQILVKYTKMLVIPRLEMIRTFNLALLRYKRGQADRKR